jgi:hypothetical protein
LAEAGKVTLKSNGYEALNDESLKKINGNEAFFVHILLCFLFLFGAFASIYRRGPTGQDSQNRTDETGKTEQDSRNGTSRMRQEKQVR